MFNRQRKSGPARAHGALYRIFFATDVHGSDVCFRKFLAAADAYSADALVLGGDLGGKGLVPATRSNGRVEVVLHGRRLSADVADRAELFERIRQEGVYPVEAEHPDVVERLATDPAHVDLVFKQEIVNQVRAWCEIAAERLAPHVRILITPGNDDPLEIDAVLADAPRIECPEHQMSQLGPIQLASMGEVPPTPWDTERELSEQALSELIDRILAESSADGPIGFNFHTPPHDCGLDMAAELDSDLTPVIRGTQPSMVPVGSHAVRAAIAQYGPVIALHGHIHEGRGFRKIGETVCLNPGSEYAAGSLSGALVDLDDRGRLVDYVLTAG